MTVLRRPWVHSLNYLIIPRNDIVPLFYLYIHSFLLHLLDLLHIFLRFKQLLYWFFHDLFTILPPKYFNFDFTHHLPFLIQKGLFYFFLDVSLAAPHRTIWTCRLGTKRLRRFISAKSRAIHRLMSGWHIVESGLKVGHGARSRKLAVDEAHILHVTVLILI